MPEISRFYGIVIRMYYDDHHPPHLHAKYEESEVVLGLLPIRILHGRIRGRALSLVIEWSVLHQQELLENWERLHRGELPLSIPPLA